MVFDDGKSSTGVEAILIIFSLKLLLRVDLADGRLRRPLEPPSDVRARLGEFLEVRRKALRDNKRCGDWAKEEGRGK